MLFRIVLLGCVMVVSSADARVSGRTSHKRASLSVKKGRPLTQVRRATDRVRHAMAALQRSRPVRIGQRLLRPVTGLRARELGERDRLAERNDDSAVGAAVVPRIFTSDSARIDYASGLVGRELTNFEVSTLLAAHEIGKGEIGLDGGRAGIKLDGSSNYRLGQLKRKVVRLRRAGFTNKEIRSLLARGVVGLQNDVLLGGSFLVNSMVLAAVTDGPWIGLPFAALGLNYLYQAYRQAGNAERELNQLRAAGNSRSK